jgi:hypothetical protein
MGKILGKKRNLKCEKGRKEHPKNEIHNLAYASTNFVMPKRKGTTEKERNPKKEITMCGNVCSYVRSPNDQS